MLYLILLTGWTESAFKDKEKALRERQLPARQHTAGAAHINAYIV